MKRKIKLTIISLLIIIVIPYSCKKGGVAPTVETSLITNVSAVSATCGGTITSEGSSPVIARGVCWAAKLNPTISDIKTQNGAGTGTYTSSITGIYEGIAYFVRAYATNSAGTSYGVTKSFVASGQSPTVTIAPATGITSTTATLNGFVNPNGILTTVVFQYGTSIVYENTKVALQSPLDITILSPVNVIITQLTSSTLYHYRITATNSLGSSFSDDLTFISKSK